MSKTNRNFIIAYVLLVGLPILGLLGVLRKGHTLTAPISIDGTWKVTADAARLAALPCGKSLAASDLALAISQSGGNFVLSLPNGPKSIAAGSIDGTSLKASVVPSGAWAGEAGCNDRDLQLVATVDPSANPRVLAGTISVNDCPACGAVEFRASRLPAPVKGAH